MALIVDCCPAIKLTLTHLCNDCVTAQAIQRALNAKNLHIRTLMPNSGIHTAGVGWASDGSPVIKVFADVSASAAGLPTEVDGVPVVVEYAGRVYALNMNCEARGLTDCDVIEAQPSAVAQPPNQRDWHPRPVPIGVSIGHPDVTAGTLGCRVSRGCHQYVLSNAHVIANVNAGVAGDSILQPGPSDGGVHPTDEIATLVESVPIIIGTDDVENKVDAALALTDSSMATTITRTNGYGEPKAATVTAEVGMLVQKYGRSSANSHGFVDMIGVTVDVGYTNWHCTLCGSDRYQVC